MSGNADDALPGLIAASTVCVILAIALIAFIAYWYYQRDRDDEEDKAPIEPHHHHHHNHHQSRHHPRAYTTHAPHVRERPPLTFFTVRGTASDGVPYVYRPPIGYPTPVVVLDEEERPRRKGHGSTQNTVRDRDIAYPTQNGRVNGAPGGVILREMESGEERMDFESSEAERTSGRLFESRRGRSKSRDRHRAKPKAKDERARSRSKSRDRIDRLRKSRSDDRFASRRSNDSATIMAKEGDIILAPANSAPVVTRTVSAPTTASHVLSEGQDHHVSRISHIRDTEDTPFTTRTETIEFTETSNHILSNGSTTRYISEPDPPRAPSPVATRYVPDPPRQPSPVTAGYSIYKPEGGFRDETVYKPTEPTNLATSSNLSQSLFKTTPRADYLFESTSTYQAPIETPREDYNSPSIKEDEQAVDSAFSFMNVERDVFSSSQPDLYPGRASPRPPTPPYDGDLDSTSPDYSYTRRIPTPPVIEDDDGDYNKIQFRSPTPPLGKRVVVSQSSYDSKGSMREKIIGTKDSPVKNAVIDELMKRRQQGGGNSPPPIPDDTTDFTESSRVQFKMSPPEIIPRSLEPESPQFMNSDSVFSSVPIPPPPPPPPPPSTNL